MDERPILFSGPMVQAILTGRKTMTRRMVKKPAALDALHVFGPSMLLRPGCADLCPYGAPGDHLWVREAFVFDPGGAICDGSGGQMDYVEPHYLYAADNQKAARKWRPSIHMPRSASRITLRVTEVRAERLHAITEADAEAEGAGLYVPGHGFITEAELSADPGYSNFLAPRMGFEAIWNSINGAGAWDANPWVWVVRFERIKP